MDPDRNGHITVSIVPLNPCSALFLFYLCSDALIQSRCEMLTNHAQIQEEEWGSCFEPAIKQREAEGCERMDFEDIMKDTFNKVLEASRAERAIVIEAFMKAYEKVKGGFGSRFMTNNWRFAIFDAFYSVKMVLPVGEDRVGYLKRRLAETVTKDLTAENWATEALSNETSALAKEESFQRTKSVEESIKSVKDVTVITEFCQAWLDELAVVEKRVADEANAK